MKYRVNTSLRTTLVLADLLLLAVALFAASTLTGTYGQTGARLPFGALLGDWSTYLTVCAVWLGVSMVLGTYQAAQNRFAFQEVAHLVKSALLSGPLMAGWMFLTADGAPRLRMLVFFALVLPLLIVFRVTLRILYRLIFKRAWGTAMIAAARVIVVGEGAVLYETLCTLSDCDPHEVAVLGYVDYKEDLASAVDAPADAEWLREAAANGALEPALVAAATDEPTVDVMLVRSSSNGTQHQVMNVVGPVHTSASARAAARWGLGAGRPAVETATDLETVQTERMKTLGTVIEELVMQSRADNVVVAISRKYHTLLSKVVAELQRLPVHIVLMPDVADLTILNVGVTELASGHPALKLRAPILTDLQLTLKRCLDLAIVSATLPLLAPVMAVVALAIKLDSPGPVLFKQRRVGQYGKQFTIYKFRTMVQDAEARLREVTTYNEDGKPLFKSNGIDPRVTRVGRLLRRLSLDELPQLFNVLKGQMSLVGPRPELPRYVGFYETWQHFRLWVPPGITGWWQIKGREKQPMYLHWDDDLYYIRNYSILLDLQILWLTLSHALLGSTGR
jgi:exopolysaccharide biosynthesis polyprenyl glycosylphosphotransferase